MKTARFATLVVVSLLAIVPLAMAQATTPAPVLTAFQQSYPKATVKSAAKGTEDGPYKLLTEIKVGGDGGWDYLSVDSAARRLYVSHATKAVVIDLDKNDVVGEITPANGVHGIAIAAGSRQGVREQRPRQHGQHRGREDAADHGYRQDRARTPTASSTSPGTRRSTRSTGRSNDATVFDAATGEVKATIKLPGKPEFAVVDVKANRIFNNIEDTSEIVAIDTTNHTVVAKWPIAPGEEASGLAMDLANHRLFAVTGNKLLVALD